MPSSSSSFLSYSGNLLFYDPSSIHSRLESQPASQPGSTQASNRNRKLNNTWGGLGVARILVVDDQRNMRTALAMMLRGQGYEIEEAENGDPGD